MSMVMVKRDGRRERRYDTDVMELLSELADAVTIPPNENTLTAIASHLTRCPNRDAVEGAIRRMVTTYDRWPSLSVFLEEYEAAVQGAEHGPPVKRNEAEVAAFFDEMRRRMGRPPYVPPKYGG